MSFVLPLEKNLFCSTNPSVSSPGMSMQLKLKVAKEILF